MIVSPGSEVVDPVSCIYVNNVGAGIAVQYDFQAAGYTIAGGAPLNNPAWGMFTLTILDAFGNPAIVTVNGIQVPAVDLPYLLAGTDHFAAYVVFNAPINPGAYRCSSVFTKTGGQNNAPYNWTLSVQ